MQKYLHKKVPEEIVLWCWHAKLRLKDLYKVHEGNKGTNVCVLHKKIQ